MSKLGPKGILGVVFIALIVGVAIFAPMVISASAATKMDFTARLAGPSLAHPLGTDQLGRDVMLRVLLGTRTSVGIAGSAVALALLIGVSAGLVAGFFGGWVDAVLMRIVDALLSFPALLLALAISAILGPSVTNTIIAIGAAYTPLLARMVRSESMRVARLPFVEAAAASGTRRLPLIWRHIVPSILPAIAVQATITLAFAILAEASLSFLGLGTQPPNSSWGLMIQASRDYLEKGPWIALAPGAAVAMTVLGLNLLGDALRDLFDPRIKS